MIYAFDINKLDVVCKNAKIIILTDSVKYHTAKFKFSEDWDNFSKTAYFINKSNDKDEKDISVPMFLGGNEDEIFKPDPQAEIQMLKQELANYDYIGVKIAMGVATIDDYEEQIAYTEELRAKIRALEGTE